MTSLLLDTHALLWALGDPDRLSPAARAALEAAELPAYVSAASIWEVAIKRRAGKLEAPEDLVAQAQQVRFEALPIDLDHGRLAGELPLHHRDPFDRMLIAQAIAGRHTIVSRDPHLAAYGVPVLW